ncbi:uroporphyrinogen-III C-methyltransferase [Agarilytica rhodophyticola]|uniref:uroporphyrinogen-III C-methyltransferase n=1 Tax=Agarilytica rhodophyticola TaxID=1737490 RepID=UPI000B349D9B|nr:uroporphyrinogen-III C-methyltransferase [Agarilytica rhodophyticola]
MSNYRNQPGSPGTVQPGSGKVWLVGAGPGDPELMTLKAMRVIEQADLILFDQLVSDEIKALLPKSIPLFYVGKRKGHHSIAQKDLNSLLVKKALAGHNIVRLKGGDPFVFGRGGEELLSLVNEGVEVEIIPGITAASGCSASSTIPLTHRGLAQGCTFITGHGEKTLDLDWQALAKLNHTLVFYMGLTNATVIENKLLDAGMSPTMPIAIIENGCRKEQRQIMGSLENLNSLVIEHAMVSPSLIIIGDVVNIAKQVNELSLSRAELDKHNIKHQILDNTKCA